MKLSRTGYGVLALATSSALLLSGCASGGSDAGGSTGGEATHVLTENEMPAHRHKIAYPNASGEYGDAAIGYPTSSGTTKTWLAEMCKTESVGGGAAHNNMPPYLAVYVWKRIA